jgi:hypothetical protein
MACLASIVRLSTNNESVLRAQKQVTLKAEFEKQNELFRTRGLGREALLAIQEELLSLKEDDELDGIPAQKEETNGN